MRRNTLCRMPFKAHKNEVGYIRQKSLGQTRFKGKFRKSDFVLTLTRGQKQFFRGENGPAIFVLETAVSGPERKRGIMHSLRELIIHRGLGEV